MLKNSFELFKKPLILVPFLIFWLLCIAFVVVNFFSETRIFIADESGKIVGLNYLPILQFVSASLYVIIFLSFIALIAGIGNILKFYPRINICTSKDLYSGIVDNYERPFLAICLFILLIIVLSLISNMFWSGLAFILKWLFSIPNIIDMLKSIVFLSNVNLLKVVKFLISMLVFPLIVPLLAAWIPSIVLNDIELKEGLKNSIYIGITHYIKLYFLAIIYFIPKFLYFMPLSIYCFVTNQQILASNKIFYAFVALDSITTFLGLFILSFYIIYLFVFCNRLKEKAVYRAVREIVL